MSVHLGWNCDNVRASYDEIPKAVQEEVYAGAKAFVKANKGRYKCGGYIYSGNGQELGQFWAKLAVGNAKILKVSSNASITNDSDVYSLAGAVYGVFSDKECKNVIATLTTDNSGNTEEAEVKAGTVYIKEQSAPKGFKLDHTIYPLTVEAGKTATLKVSDTPKVTETLLELFKIDMETSKDMPQGNASLAGAEFIWQYYDGYYNKDNLPAEPTRIWTTKTIAEKNGDGTAFDTLPYGKYRLDESKAPEGYLKDGAVSREFIIAENGKIVDLTGEESSIYNQIKRGDIEGVKIGAGTHKRLADVPFKLTSKTTGESHIVVTDKNGQFSTASDWASHKHNTNAGKTSEDGIWFGTAEPDDSKGALLYDTYVIEELRCTSNKCFKLIPAFDIVVSRDRTVIDLGTLTDEYEKEISIHTTATSKDGEKVVEAGKEVTIIDTVKLDGLEIGTKYQLKGWQMIKDENAELVIDGKRVENDYSFVADSETMEVQIVFTFDASELGGKDLVTFEELYDLTNPDEPKKVTEHKDTTDKGQTVSVKEKSETPAPEEPEKPSTPDTPVQKTDSPKTGDTTNVIGLLALLGASSIGLAGTYFYKKRKAKKL
ncbi:LPXTG-motif cell wall anchor domain-containing protein [Lactonifactor longoviformis DSM 17459]|uniref:LPXTG-motif cell wall anchor domain-containing protein n=1 Tax=Lactonifactor longoviformis DSM 17459 TaxID=1122155 RepID=A0A1M5CU09_9CLOT|nr:LPXTG-motif cell wall anchor domain-containing protein [Lactonifactor longoviformis DSM 17459]